MLTDFSDAMASYWERDPLITQFVQMGYMDYGVTPSCVSAART